MSTRLTRRGFGWWLTGVGLLASASLLTACGGGQPQSFQPSGNGAPASAPTDVTGRSNTSGISAGSALQPSSGTPTATPSK